MTLDESGKNLENARTKKGLSRKELAKLLGRKQGYTSSISQWENGHSPVPKKHRKTVSHILGIPESEFVPSIGSVYLYYYPADGESETKRNYPCRIGSTEKSVDKRVKEKIREWGYKKMPKIALTMTFPIDEIGAWEGMIHGVLTLMGRKCDRYKGNEWFYTSPGEVEAICKSIDEWVRKAGYMKRETTN